MIRITYYAFKGYEGEDATPIYEVETTSFDTKEEAENFLYNYLGCNELIKVEGI